MKKIHLIFTILIGILFSGCSNDNDDNATVMTGEIIINGQTFVVNKGFIIPNYTGTDPNYDPRRFYIVLANGDVSLENNEFVFANNITQLIDFNMYSSVSSSGSIENTSYAIYNPTDPNFNSDNAFIDHANIGTNVVVQNNQVVTYDSLSSDDLTGQATITQNNGIFTITYAFSNSQNTISGSFTGNLTDLNYQY